MRRSELMMAAVLIAAVLSVPGAAGAQSPSKSQSSNGNVWYGVEEYFGHAANSNISSPIYDCGSLNYYYTIRFRRVEDAKTQQTLSLSLNWSGSGDAKTAGYAEDKCQGSGDWR